MAKRIRKVNNTTFETDGVVEKFGEKVSKHELLGGGAEVQQLQVESKTHLEDDIGSGNAAIIRMFEFGMNLHTFNEVRPTKQQIFNSHLKGIEVALWKDGLKPLTSVEPKITLDAKTRTYRIFVGAQPMKGHILREQPKTLKQIVHNV